MKTTKEIKKEILRSILNFETRINIEHPQAKKLFDEVLDEHPEAKFYIKSIRPHSLFGFGSKGRFVLSYTNTDISPQAVKKAETYDEVEIALRTCVEKYLPIAILCVPASIDISKSYYDFMVEYEGFYSNLVGLEYTTQSFALSSTKYVTFEFQYRIGRVKLNMMERAVDEEVERISEFLFSKDMLPETKAYVAHNYLVKTVKYWLKEEANPLEESYMQSAYGALINHKCVCQGYAEAYKRLMDSQGIICDVICGKIRGSQAYHAWNAISFDGKIYYHVDVTWDVSESAHMSWEYFCKSDAQMTPTRIWTRKPGLVCSSEKNILSVAQSQIASKKLTFKAQGIDSKYL